MRPSKHQLIDALQTHQGAERGVSAEYLAKLLDTDPRVVRGLVTELREDGVPVCGHPKSGYFIALTSDELEQTVQFLRARAMKSLHLEARLRRISLPDLLGQLKLQT